MADQASNLRQFVRKQQQRGRVIAVTSGKGGVGKTTTSVNLAIALAGKGKRVILLDADLGLANVEVLLGLNSLYNLQHVIDGERTILEILTKGPGGIEVVPGSSGLAKFADLDDAARNRLIDSLEELQQNADFLIVDTMAGIGQNAVAFSVAADEVLLVATPEPSSIVDAYAMIKAITAMRADAVLRLVVNQAGSPEQGRAVADKLAGVTKQYLGRNLSYLGMIPRDPHVSQAVMQTYPVALRYPHAPASRGILDLANRVIHQKVLSDPSQRGFFKRVVQSLGLAG